MEDPQSSQSWPGIVRREGGREEEWEVQMKLEIRGEERGELSVDPANFPSGS